MTDLPATPRERATTALGRADPLVRGGALDALRFLAAAFFVLYHYDRQAPVPLAQVHEAFTRGYLVTDFFLILSGYVLARTYGPRLQAGGIGWGAFLLRRVARVWPAYALILCGFAALVAVAAFAGVQLNNPEAFPWWEFPGQLLLVQAWGLGFGPTWNTPTWSLSALIFCYALFPLLWRGMSRTPPAAALALALLLLVAADLAARAFGLNFYEFPRHLGIVRAVPLFVFGLALARYGAPSWLGPRGAFALCLGAGLTALALQALGRFDFLAMSAIGLMILAAGARATARPSKLVARGAEISFALYVSHTLVGVIWYRALEFVVPAGLTGPAAWAVWSTGFLAALGFAIAFHHAVDMPIKRRVDALLKRPSAPRAAPVAA